MGRSHQARERHSCQRDQERRDGGGTRGGLERRQDGGLSYTGPDAVVESADQRHEGRDQVEGEEPAEPGQRAPDPGLHPVNSAFTLAGTAVLLPPIWPLTSWNPSCLRTAAPWAPSRYFTNASAPAALGALLRTVIVYLAA